MWKKIIFLIIVLFLLGGGVFYWWQNQKDVRELNKNLPEGVRVVKSLIGKEYKVVNKIDGYEFKVPRDMEGLRDLEYLTIQELNASGFLLEGSKGDFMKILQYKLSNSGVNLDQQVAELNEKFEGLYSEREKEWLGSFEIIKAKEDSSDIAITYFLKNGLVVYEFRGMKLLEEFIREIIINGKW